MFGADRFCRVVSQPLPGIKNRLGHGGESRLEDNTIRTSKNQENKVYRPVLEGISMKYTFVCEICSTPLGTVNLEDLSVPMKAEMFHSLDASRGIPVPFQPILDFMSFRCRQCKARPFKTHNHITILDDNGFRKSVNIAGKEFKCEQCGNTYQHESSLSRHKKEKHG